MWSRSLGPVAGYKRSDGSAPSAVATLAKASSVEVARPGFRATDHGRMHAARRAKLAQ